MLMKKTLDLAGPAACRMLGVHGNTTPHPMPTLYTMFINIAYKEVPYLKKIFKQVHQC